MTYIFYKFTKTTKSNIMKKVLFILLFISAFQVNAQDNIGKLPKNAQTFIKKQFPNEQVSYVEVDREAFGNTYEAYLQNGTEIDFDKNGNWKEIKKGSGVPDAIIPPAIKKHVDAKYAGTKIIKIEKNDLGGHEVELSNGLELIFNKQNKFVRVDN